MSNHSCNSTGETLSKRYHSLNHIKKKTLITCRDTSHLFTQDVVIGVEEGQLIHHGLFRNKVENLCNFTVFNYRHAPDRVLPLDPVQDHHVVAVAGAADPAQAAEVEKARHAHAVQVFSQTVQAAD